MGCMKQRRLDVGVGVGMSVDAAVGVAVSVAVAVAGVVDAEVEGRAEAEAMEAGAIRADGYCLQLVVFFLCSCIFLYDFF